MKTLGGPQAVAALGGDRASKNALWGSVFGHVDRAGGLVPSREDQHAPHGDVLADHQTEFGDFGGGKVFGKLAPQSLTRRTEIQGEFFGKAYRECVPGLEFSLRRGSMDLLDGLLVESLTRRRRVTGEESGIALVEGRHLQSRELLDSGGHHAFVVGLSEEFEISLEMFRDQFERVHEVDSAMA